MSTDPTTPVVIVSNDTHIGPRLVEDLRTYCLRMPLVTHVGAGTNARCSGPEGVALLQIESGGFTSRRAVWWLILAGVFERHPGLELVITETPGNRPPGS